MKSRRRATFPRLLAPLVVLFAAPDLVVAQTIRILPRGADDTEWAAAPYEVGTPAALEDGSIQLYAVLELNGVRVDVSDLCSWAITSDGSTAWHSADRALGLAPGTTAVVRVSWGGIEATTAVSWLIPEGTGPERAMDDRDGTIPTQAELGTAVVRVLDQLQGIGVPMDAWRTAASNTVFADNRNAVRTVAGAQVPMTGPSTAARFLKKGIYISLDEDNWPGVSYFELDLIVFRPDIAEALVNPPPDAPIFKDNPNLAHIADWAKIPIHELLHKILLYEGLEDQFPRTPNPFDDETEDLVSRVENRLFPNAAAILRTLALPELTDGDRQSLFYRVRDFRVEVQNLRQDYGTNLVNSILEALGWTDSDGDGLPDWLEDKLRERGIDPDKPIWTPPPGGGGNPQPVDDPPLPGDGEPTVEPVPEVVPADPNG